MAEPFDDEIRTDLEERGFTNDQIDILESFPRDKYGLHSDIEKLMDDYDYTPEQIMNYYNEEEREEGEEGEIPQQGGKRKRSRSRKTKKQKKTKRKSRKSRKSKRNRR